MKNQDITAGDAMAMAGINLEDVNRLEQGASDAAPDLRSRCNVL